MMSSFIVCNAGQPENVGVMLTTTLLFGIRVTSRTIPISTSDTAGISGSGTSANNAQIFFTSAITSRLVTSPARIRVQTSDLLQAVQQQFQLRHVLGSVLAHRRDADWN